MTKTAAAAKPAKAEGKISKLLAMWADAGAGELLPRTFAVELAIAEGVNPSTARTQYQLWYKRCQQAVTQEQAPTQ
jgi:hypothetical protein